MHCPVQARLPACLSPRRSEVVEREQPPATIGRRFWPPLAYAQAADQHVWSAACAFMGTVCGDLLSPCVCSICRVARTRAAHTLRFRDGGVGRAERCTGMPCACLCSCPDQSASGCGAAISTSGRDDDVEIEGNGGDPDDGTGVAFGVGPIQVDDERTDRNPDRRRHQRRRARGRLGPRPSRYSLHWGGETQGVGFDCSGLVQAAYRAAGITLPRVAQDQYDAGPRLPPDEETLELGDLVFFGGGPTDVSHVGSTLEPKADKPSWSTPPTPAPTSESNHSPPPSEQASGVGT